MPRPTGKEDLLAAMQKEHDALEKQLSTLSPEEMTRPPQAGAWSVKDVLAHLTEWEQMVLSWHRAGLQGITPAVPGEGFNWGQLPALNEQIYQKHRQRPLEEVLQAFEVSYRQLLETVRGLDEEDLFTPGRFAWTKKNTLGAYFVSAGSSHYAWARKEIRKCVKPAQPG